MSFDGIDEWDENFLNEAIRIEIEATSSRDHLASSGLHRPPEDPPPSFGLEETHGGLSFSPPRELSQRFPDRPEPSRVWDDCEIIEPSTLRNGGYGSRTGAAAAKKDREVERLKRELGRLSKKLVQMEHECVELQKDGAKKDEQLKCASLQLEVKDAEIRSLRRENLETSKKNHTGSDLQFQATVISSEQAGLLSEEKQTTQSFPVADKREIFVGKSRRAIEPNEHLPLDSHMLENHGPKQKDVEAHASSAISALNRRIVIDGGLSNSTGVSVQRTAPLKSSKTTGVQTDLHDYTPLAPTDQFASDNNISYKLRAIWGSSRDRKSGRDLVSKLLAICSADFCELFRCMSVPVKANVDSQADECVSDMLPDGIPSVQLNYAAKISQLNTALIKMHKEMMQLHTLLEALLELCCVDNVVIAHRSLRILRIILEQLLTFDVKPDRRNNVLFDFSEDNFPKNGSSVEKSQNLKSLKCGKEDSECEKSDSFSPSSKEFHLQNLFKNEDQSWSMVLPIESWVSLFTTILQITKKNSDECILIEAISIMNLIMRRSNPNSERDKFQMLPLLETLSLLLRKEVGLHVRLQAIHLLFLFLNCQRILAIFCTGKRDNFVDMETEDGQKDSSALQRGIGSILEGLAESLSCRGTSAQELKLQRHVIITLAFIASSNKSGFEILINPATSQGVNFLDLIIRLLASEVDAELQDSIALDFCNERRSLMREALILLNRLASSPAYSKAALGVLTGSSATACLTIDVANRLSWKGRGCGKQDVTKKTQLENEILDLARIFRTRVFSFLGEVVS